jgi:tripartite-type tricarboxylate transporter receptor subunit TctC
VATNKVLYDNPPYDPERDLAAISLLATAPQALVSHTSVPAKNFKEFLAYARSNPGKMSYGTTGSGSASHLTMELLKNDARVFIVHIPYRGFPPAITDMLAGNIDTMFAIIPAVLPHVRAGKMKGVAVTGLKRSPAAPDIPSVAELGFPQLESLAWNGLLAPAGTPPAVISRLSAEAVGAMRLAQTREALGRLGFDVVASSPEEFARWIRAESEKWARVIRASGATAD